MAGRSTRELRIRRHQRIRQKVNGTARRPRLAVYRSNVHIYAQVIDDVRGVTLVAASSVDPTLRQEASARTKTADAEAVGRLVAERAKAAGITQVVYDRGGFRYHGRIKALAEAARAAGLEF